MYPRLFTIPGTEVTIYSYGVMLVVGALAGLTWVKWDAEGRGIGGQILQRLALWVFLPGVVGTRLLFVLAQWEAYARLPWYRVVDFSQGGLVWYGGH